MIAGLKSRITESVKKCDADGILFSGGLDSSILACLKPGIKAITVTLKDYGEDIGYFERAASFLKLEHYHVKIDINEAINAIPDVIRILKSFDPAIPNDLAVFFGLRKAKKLGLAKVMAGDGSDELFAGYSFMEEIDNLEEYIKSLSKKMFFSSNEIGNALGLEVAQPYLDKDVIDFALQIPVSLKIKHSEGKTWGKWILRQAFSGMLPDEIIWQSKRPLEYGSGMTKLRGVISSGISDKEFKNADAGVKFICKDHLYYYRIYRKVIGSIPEPEQGKNPCPGCGAGLKKDTFHCKVCGYVLMSYLKGGE